jgi:hypothetical protein
VLEVWAFEYVRLLIAKLPLDMLEASGLCLEQAFSKFNSELPIEEGNLKTGLYLLDMIDFVSEMLKLSSFEGVTESWKKARSTYLLVSLVMPAKLEFEQYFRICIKDSWFRLDKMPRVLRFPGELKQRLPSITSYSCCSGASGARLR